MPASKKQKTEGKDPPNTMGCKTSKPSAESATPSAQSASSAADAKYSPGSPAELRLTTDEVVAIEKEARAMGLEAWLAVGNNVERLVDYVLAGNADNGDFRTLSMLMGTVDPAKVSQLGAATTRMSAMDEIVAQGVPAGHGDAADANQDGMVTRSEAAAYDEVQKGNDAPAQAVSNSAASLTSASSSSPSVSSVPMPDVLHKIDTEWQNWGKNNNTKPCVTFFPIYAAQVVQIVQYALKIQKRVRVSAYRHSWAPTNADDGQVQICMLSEKQSGRPSEPTPVAASPLYSVTLNPKDKYCPGQYVTAGAACSNDNLRAFCIANEVQFEANVILVDNTLVGTTSMCCHGSGVKTKGLADQVVGLTLVDGTGQLQKLWKTDHPADWPSLCGAFGTMGVIVDISFKVYPMKYANMVPKWQPLDDAVPRPGQTAGEFNQLLLSSSYNEWFWFPTLKKVYVNCWKDDGDADKNTSFPTPGQVSMMGVKENLFRVCNETIFKALTPLWRAKIMAAFSERALSTNPVVTQVPNAQHFVRHIHAQPVRDAELNIELGSLENDPDATKIIQEVWWAAIDYITEQTTKKLAPIDLTLEMRIFNGCAATLAPQNGFSGNTLAIEMLSTTNVDNTDFEAACSAIFTLWLAVAKKYNKRARPHHAKQWTTLQFGDKSAMDYVRESYGQQINVFNATRKKYDPEGMFGNELYNSLLAPID